MVKSKHELGLYKGFYYWVPKVKFNCIQAQYYDQYRCNLTGFGLLVNVYVLYTAQLGTKTAISKLKIFTL